MLKLLNVYTQRDRSLHWQFTKSIAALRTFTW